MGRRHRTGFLGRQGCAIQCGRGDQHSRIVQHHQGKISGLIRRGHGREGGGVGQHADHTSVPQQEPDPPSRVPGVNGQVRTASLPDRQHRRHHVHAAGQAQPDDAFDADAHRTQVARQAVGAYVQLSVGDFDVAADDSRAVRGPRRLGGEQLRYRRVRHIAGRVVPYAEQPTSLLVDEHVHVAEPGLRVGDQCHDDPGEPGGDRLDGGRIEQVGRPRDHPAQTGGTSLVVDHLRDGQVYVEPGDGLPRRQTLNLYAGDSQRRTLVVLHEEHHLEQRMPGQ